MFRDKAADGTIRLTGAIPVGGEAGPQGPIGPQGPEGPEGPQGPEGTVDAHSHEDLYYTEAEANDRFVPVIKNHSNMTHGIGLAHLTIAGSNIPGSLVIHTNVPFGNHMCNFQIRGYNYQGEFCMISLDVGFYAYAVGPTFVNHGAVNNGLLPVLVRLGRRLSDNTVVVILDSEGPGNFWQYPKLWVDAMVGHTQPANTELQGWSIVSTTDLSPYVVSAIPNIPPPHGDTKWITATLASGWTHWDTTNYGPVAYRRLNGVVYIRGLAKRALANSGGSVIFTLPVGFRPERNRVEDGLISYAPGSSRFDVLPSGGVQYPNGGTNPANAYYSVVAEFPADV